MKQVDLKNIHNQIWIVFGIGLFIHILFWILEVLFFPDFHWPHVLFHSSIEIAGASFCIVSSFFLVSLQKIRVLNSNAIIIASCFWIFAIFDGFHAISEPGNKFVFLHSLATFYAGLVISLLWVNSFLKLNPYKFLIYNNVIAFLIGGAYYFDFIQNPLMLVGIRFSDAAIFLNITGGIFFILASIRLFTTSKTTTSHYQIIFSLIFFILGLAAISFKLSSLFGLSWWGWHLLRIAGYFISIQLLVETYKIQNRELYLKNLEVNKKNSELLEKNKELERFVYIASHDLQEPLNTIKSYSLILRQKTLVKYDDFERKCFEFLEQGAIRMSTLINSLLEYSRIGRKPEFKLIDANTMVNDILKDLNARIIIEKAKIKVNKLPMLRGNEIEIRILFQNLISNAIKFHKMEQKPLVEIRGRLVQNKVTFEIKDNGIGIPKNKQDEVFRIFKQLNPKSKYEGNGMGLSFCKRIIDLHKGNIFITSELNHGTLVTFELPNQPTKTE